MSTCDTETTRLQFPKDGICVCGASEWYDTETGYCRMSKTLFEDGALRVFSDGWDDMSEGGEDQFATCAMCGATYDLPEKVEYE